MPACPDISKLEALAAGELSPDEAAVVEKHAEGCGRCAKRLSRIPVDDDLLDEIRILEQSRCDMAPALEEMRSRHGEMSQRYLVGQMFDFNIELATLAEMPAEDFEVSGVRQLLRETLARYGVETWLDPIGNLYAARRGHLAGHLMLCAHMDKNLQKNFVNRSSLLALERSVGDHASEWASRFVFFEHDKSGDFREIASQTARTRILTEGIPLFALPRCRRVDSTLLGKLDDAVGLAALLEVFATTDPERTPTLSALFTVQEESSLRGSEFAAREDQLGGLRPDALMVIDVCPHVPLATGLILYADCGAYRWRSEHDKELKAKELLIAQRSRPLVQHIQTHVEAHSIPLTTMRPGSNDAYHLARHTMIPTVAIEVPIAHCHAAVEQVAVSDLDDLRRFLRSYVPASHHG